ncbi:MAG TPA: hypothetical protein VFX44_09580 [Solirubrobacterales bacterium]|nr:hypothetical protein [Solirubrobacterales bacterium]
MTGARWGKIAAMVAALTLIWAASARAADVEALPSGYGAFLLHGTHGYSILARAYPEEGSQEEMVSLWVFRKGAAAFYEVPAKVDATKVEARLGGVGRISVRFHPRGKPRIASIKCSRGAKLRYQPGVWMGRIEFKGEEGFTRVEARSAKQITWPLLLIACPYVTEPVELGAGLPGALLSAGWRSKSRSVGLRAIANRPGGNLKLSASIEEQRGQLRVIREAEGRYPGTGFEFDPTLSTATLHPAGSFFSGAATYSRSAEPQSRWSGDLSVDLPGRSDLPLTGARFGDVSLEHARYTREKRYDERPKGGESRGRGDFANQWLTNSPRSIGGLLALLRRSMGS